MRRVCAWCGKELSAGDHRHDDVISHGICTDCMEHFASGTRVLSLREYLDKLDVPVVVVDDDLRILTANDRNTVTDTYRNSKSHVKVPAYANHETGGSEEKVRFLISTEKAGAFVLLRIDEVGRIV